ncbi:hypothetical protein [Mesorhizobium sp.]|uniref:hypothetical protein n=1 Tax=Mesorhizobium sp. TaxID=1871066 RepID=UPI0012254C89|nr:hypothetical protein [Mesorhizobium sp.]TIP07486.1 MAG: hypothetical protein E5X73_36610 [Mesorhizobium sp.]
MSYPTTDEVYRVLERYEQPLMSLHLKAWDRLVSNTAWPTLIFQRTASSIMHDFIVQEAGTALDDLPGMRRIVHDKSVRYLVDDRVLFRFKRGTRNGLGSNIDTQANDDFIDAEVDLLGIPQIWKVELLWYPNKLRTKLDRIEVSARDGKRRLWAYTLGNEPDIAWLPLDLPVGPTAPARPATGLVTVKPLPKTVENKDDE